MREKKELIAFRTSKQQKDNILEMAEVYNEYPAQIIRIAIAQLYIKHRKGNKINNLSN